LPTAPKSTQLPLDIIFDRKQFKTSIITSESPEEVAARIVSEKLEGDHRRKKDLCLTLAGISFVGVILFGCLVAAFLPGITVEDRTWAKSILVAIVTGFVGFLTGRAMPAHNSGEGRS
jgi:hypothetical protein